MRARLATVVTALTLIALPLGAQATGGGKAASKRPERSVVCRGAVVPAGWVLVDDLRDRNSCDGQNPAAVNAYNVWAIEKFQDRPVGTEIEVCAASPTPAGWVIVDVYRDKDACGHPSELFIANVKKIRRTR
jgi:uncharacterized protein YbdZ (MbtH family)